MNKKLFYLIWTVETDKPLIKIASSKNEAIKIYNEIVDIINQQNKNAFIKYNKDIPEEWDIWITKCADIWVEKCTIKKINIFLKESIDNLF